MIAISGVDNTTFRELAELPLSSTQLPFYSHLNSIYLRSLLYFPSKYVWKFLANSSFHALPTVILYALYIVIEVHTQILDNIRFLTYQYWIIYNT
jgi:hypothetical protein